MEINVPKIAITMGDPAGIGPEVTIKALLAMDISGIIPIVYGGYSVLQTYLRCLGESGNPLFEFIDIADLKNNNLSPGKIYFYEAGSENFDCNPGKGSVESGIESIKYLDSALYCWSENKIDAVVTGPVNKGYINQGGIPFKGHTEYIAEYVNSKTPYMLMYSENYSVLLVTTHYKIDELSELINFDNIFETIKIGSIAMSKIKGRQAKVAITGLDPHCGDNGAIGLFDSQVTTKVVEKSKEAGIDIEGPFSADTLFLPGRWKQYDLVIAMYHDQGLIPFKMLSFDNGVNVTLGLPIIRTSVDHGTAYDIAGKGTASFSSMIEAIKLAEKLINI